MIDGFQRGYERGARDVGTLANAGYRNGRGSAMRYGSRIGRDTGRFGIFRLRRISLFTGYGETAVLVNSSLYMIWDGPFRTLIIGQSLAFPPWLLLSMHLDSHLEVGLKRLPRLYSSCPCFSREIHW